MDRDGDLVVPGMLIHHEIDRALEEYRADLRAKVETLKCSPGVGLSTVGDWAWNRALEEVVALIDGGGE